MTHRYSQPIRVVSEKHFSVPRPDVKNRTGVGMLEYGAHFSTMLITFVDNF